jgi:hypothetical protein
MPLTRSAGRPTTTPTAAETSPAAAIGQGKRQPGADERRLGVRADAEEGRMAEREQAGEAGEQHQAEADHRVDEDEGELRQPVLRDDPGRGQHRQHQQAVPEHVPAVLGQADVLQVAGLEEEAHQTFLRSFSPKMPFGRTTSISSTTDVGRDVLEALGQVEAGRGFDDADHEAADDRPGRLPKPPTTAAGIAFRPMIPMLA